jgi:hypothetical protein
MANRDAPTSTQGSPARHLTFAELGMEQYRSFGRVPLPVPVSLSSWREPFDLPFGQVFASAQIPVWGPPGATVRFTVIGVSSLKSDFALEFRPPRRQLFEENLILGSREAGAARCPDVDAGLRGR